jgi:glucokinase
VILAGDIGGTKVDLGFFEPRDGKLEPLVTRRYESADFEDLDALLRAFLAVAPGRPRRAAFGVAGPVVRGQALGTNLAWSVRVASLEALLGIEPVLLVNDLVATAAGLLDLPAESLRTLHAGTPHERGARAVLAPGTGLGQAVLAWDGQRYHALPSEGGHADFPARNETEIALLRFWLERLGHVSCEHLLAGPGIGRIYDFLRETGREEEPEWLHAELAKSEDRNSTIGRAGLEGRAAIARRTLALWSEMLGAGAGNLALTVLALGGVYLGGGIVNKLLPALEAPSFLAGYLAKGRLSDLVAKIPAAVIRDESAALRGAARLALEA